MTPGRRKGPLGPSTAIPAGRGLRRRSVIVIRGGEMWHEGMGNCVH